MPRLMRSKWYPRPHSLKHAWGFGLETGVANEATIYPITMYDEGKGDPTAYESNPENASFTVATDPNCYPDSTVEQVLAECRISLTKGAIETDKVTSIRFAYMPVYFAFKEDYTAIDELTSLEVQDILEMDSTDSTDRQGVPLWNNVDMIVTHPTYNILHADVPGLTTTQAIEGIAWNVNNYYNGLHYYTNKGKIKSCSGGLKWGMLTKNRPVAKIRIRQRPKTKRMNEFTFFGLLIWVPKAGDFDSNQLVGDTTNITHVQASFLSRFSEWNEFFNHRKV